MELFQLVLILLLVILIATILSIGLKHSMSKWNYNVKLPQLPLTKRLDDGFNNPMIIGHGETEVGCEGCECDNGVSCNGDCECQCECCKPTVGGRVKDVADEVYERMVPYAKETGEDDVIEYLLTYLDYSASKKSRLKKERHPLKAVIKEIYLDHDIKDVEDFLRKTRLNYGSFLDDERRGILTSALLHADISDKDRKAAKHLYDNYLNEEEVFLTGSNLKEKVDELLLAYREFKFKKGVAKMSLDKIKKLTKSGKGFELDLLGMRSAMQREARRIASRDGSKDVISKIKRDMTRLKLLREYPDIYLDDVLTMDELARRLSRAADRISPLRKSSYLVSPILSDLARERAESDKYAAQRNARQASDRANKAEREREEQRTKADNEKQKALDERQKREMVEQREAERFRNEEEDRARELEQNAPAANDNNDIRALPAGVDQETWNGMLTGLNDDQVNDLRATIGMGEDPVLALERIKTTDPLDNIEQSEEYSI